MSAHKKARQLGFETKVLAAFAAGMDELLVKPVNLARLKMALAAWLPPIPHLTSPLKGEELDKSAPDAVPPAPTFATLDVSVLAARVGDDPAILRDFLLDFRAGAATIADELSAACVNGEMERVEALAHKLKSSARSVGALALGELCAELEAAGKAGQSAALPRVWLRFTTEMAAVDAALNELTAPRDTPDREAPR